MTLPFVVPQHQSDRMPREEYFLRIARLVGLRATCPRARGGTVVTFNNRILVTGYAGSPRGMAHCLDVGCLIEPPDPGCKRVLHAEIGAITFAAAHGIGLDKCEVYTTLSPCLGCAKALINLGVIRVIYEIEYRIRDGLDLLTAAGIPVVCYPHINYHIDLSGGDGNGNS